MKILLAIFAVMFYLLLMLPLFSMVTGWPPDVRLSGEEPEVAPAAWGLSAWWNGAVQSEFDAWLAARIGLRGVLVRTANQIAYSLFRELPKGTGTRVVAGKAGFLFENTYVDAYRRGGSQSEKLLRRRSAEVRRLQDRMARDGIAFWLVIAPSKAEIYPEYLPAEADVAGRPSRRSHYERMIGFLQADGVNVVDGHALFQEWKRDPATPPLFPAGGTHWNRYGAGRVVALLLDRLREGSGKPWPVLRVTGAETDRKIIAPDNDLGELANLWQGRSLAGPQTHPVIEVDPGDEKPDILLICDSFGAMIGEMLQRERLIRRHDAYFYNKRHFGSSDGRRMDSAFDAGQVDALQRVAGRDAVVIEEVEYFLPEIGFGFVGQLLKAYDALDGKDAKPAS